MNPSTSLRIKKTIGILSVFCSVLLISYSIFGWVWAAYDYTWTLTEIYSNGNTTSTTGGTATAEDSSGVTHIASLDDETGGSDNQTGLVYSRYVGSGGNCDSVTDASGNSDGSDAWNCRVIDASGTGGGATTVNVDMSIVSDVIYISYSDGSDVYLATCNDSSDDCDTTGSWTTTNIADDGVDPSLDVKSSSLIGISYVDTVTNEVVTARYVASSGSCDDSFGGTSDNYDCEVIETTEVVTGNAKFVFDSDNMYHTFYSISDDSTGNHCNQKVTKCLAHAVRDTAGSGIASDDADWELYSFETGFNDVTGVDAAIGSGATIAKYAGVELPPMGGENLIVAYSSNGNVSVTGCSGEHCYENHYGSMGIAIGGDIPSVQDDPVDSSAKVTFGNNSTGLTKTYMAESVTEDTGNCDSILGGSNDWKCYEATNSAGAYNHGHTSFHLSDPQVTLGTGGGLYQLDGEEEPEPTVPEFTSKLAAVVIGASALGLFGLIVLFRGRKRKV